MHVPSRLSQCWRGYVVSTFAGRLKAQTEEMSDLMDEVTVIVIERGEKSVSPDTRKKP